MKQVVSDLHPGIIWSVIGESNNGYICSCNKLKAVIPKDKVKEYIPEVYETALNRKFVYGQFVTSSHQYSNDRLWKVIQYNETGTKVMCRDRNNWNQWIEEKYLTLKKF